MDLPLNIKELLQAGGSLVVPGLGRFYSQHRPARIDKERNVLVPPGHTLHFDPETRTDDGVLCLYLCRKYAVPEAGARKAVSEFAAGLNEELTTNGQAGIPYLGSLKAEADGISFSPLAQDGPLDGLLPILEISEGKDGEMPDQGKERKETLAPGKERTEIAAPVKHTPEARRPSATRPLKRTEKRSILWLPVTLLVLITGLAAILYFTGTFQSMRFDLGRTIAADSNPSTNGNRMVFGRPPVNTDTSEEALSRQLDELTAKENALAYREPGAEDRAAQTPGMEPEIDAGQPLNTEPVTSALPEPAKPAGISPPVSAGNYHIIAGSFRELSNAERQKARLDQQGYRASVIRPEDPYYMVSVASYASLDEAVSSLDRLRRQLDIQLWVKKVE